MTQRWCMQAENFATAGRPQIDLGPVPVVSRPWWPRRSTGISLLVCGILYSALALIDIMDARCLDAGPTSEQIAAGCPHDRRSSSTRQIAREKAVRSITTIERGTTSRQMRVIQAARM